MPCGLHEATRLGMMNATLAAAGHNLRMLLRKLRLSWLDFLHSFLRDLSASGFLGAAA